MSLFISRVSLEVNGAIVTDIKAVSENARVLRKAVPLMYKSGAVELTQRYGGTFDYVVPQTAPMSFDDVTAGTLTVEYDNGDRVDFGGVHVTEVGDATVDGENELVSKISWIAETRNGASGA
jgi:hypothetical protein